MTTQAIKLMTFGLYGNKSEARRAGSVGRDSVAVLQDLGGSTLHCTGGTLWVTVEGDLKDYVLHMDETLPIPTLGKVIVSGRGSYRAA